MEAVVSIIKRFSGVSNYRVWSNHFTRTVDHVIQSRITTTQRIYYIQKCEKWVKNPKFENTARVELIRGKLDLLRLWDYLLDFVVNASDNRHKELGYEIIVHIMQRQDFRLEQHQVEYMKSNMKNKYLEDTVRALHKYKSLLVKTFLFVNKEMEKKGRVVELIHFAAQTLAIFFFRLPVVGGRIIDALETKLNDPVIISSMDRIESVHSPIDFSDCHPIVDEEEDAKLGAQFFQKNPDLFEWNHFYSDDEEEIKSLKSLVQSKENSCMNWITTKETFFLTFLEMFCLHVDRVGIQPVKWNSLPAYQLIVKCFWKLLKSAIWWDGICKREENQGEGWVKSYAAYMRVQRTATAMLLNKSLISEFIYITFACTNVNSLLSVDSSIEHMNLWFVTVAYSPETEEGVYQDVPHGPGTRSEKAKQHLPKDFNYKLFWRGTSKLLESELFQSLLKTLSFLYNNFHFFRGRARVELVNEFLSQYFMSLFLHWSSEVRTYFQHLLVYKVLRPDRRYLPCFTDAIVMARFGDPGVSIHHSENESRRLSVFDATSETDNEEILIDVAHCSKIDSYIRMLLEDTDEIPEKKKIYVSASLTQYAILLHKYYNGVQLNSLDSIPLLTHRMVMSESNPYN